MSAKVIFEGNYSRYRSTLMGVAMLSIMFSHQRFVHVFPFNVFESFGHWGVDVFLFLSGMGMVGSLMAHTVKEFYFRRFKRLIPLCVLCGTIKYGVFLLSGSVLENLEVGLNIGPWSIFSLDLWFVWSIFFYYLLSPLFFRWLKSYPYVFMLLSFVMAFIMHYKFAEKVGYDWLNPLGIALYTIDRLPVFLIGMLVAIYKERLQNYHFLCSATFAIITVCLALLLKVNYLPSPLQAFVYPLLSLGVLSIITIQVALFQRSSEKIVMPLSFIGKHSLEIYLVHEFVFAAFLLTLFTRCNHYLLLLSSFVLSIIVAWCCRWCVERLNFGTR